MEVDERWSEADLTDEDGVGAPKRKRGDSSEEDAEEDEGDSTEEVVAQVPPVPPWVRRPVRYRLVRTASEEEDRCMGCSRNARKGERNESGGSTPDNSDITECRGCGRLWCGECDLDDFEEEQFWCRACCTIFNAETRETKDRNPKWW